MPHLVPPQNGISAGFIPLPRSPAPIFSRSLSLYGADSGARRPVADVGSSGVVARQRAAQGGGWREAQGCCWRRVPAAAAGPAAVSSWLQKQQQPPGSNVEEEQGEEVLAPRGFSCSAPATFRVGRGVPGDVLGVAAVGAGKLPETGRQPPRFISHATNSHDSMSLHACSFNACKCRCSTLMFLSITVIIIVLVTRPYKHLD